jgi:hypothetical protein
MLKFIEHLVIQFKLELVVPLPIETMCALVTHASCAAVRENLTPELFNLFFPCFVGLSVTWPCNVIYGDDGSHAQR